MQLNKSPSPSTSGDLVLAAFDAWLSAKTYSTECIVVVASFRPDVMLPKFLQLVESRQNFFWGRLNFMHYTCMQVNQTTLNSSLIGTPAGP